jgi:tRNA threonylcarbamoyladenosine biosynthesis protein TsaB
MVDEISSSSKYLILETSSRYAEVALANHEEILASRILTENRRNASDLTLIVAELVSALGWKITQIDGMIASLGPGSFTSLRVGLMSAKALAYINQCSIYGVGTFDAIVHQAPNDVQNVFVISDALQGNVYSARYVRENQGWTISEPLAIRSFQTILENLSPETKLSGPGLQVYREKVDSKTTLPDPCWQPRCESLFQIVKRNPSLYLCDSWFIEPIYLRGSSAEEKRNKLLIDKSK